MNTKIIAKKENFSDTDFLKLEKIYKTQCGTTNSQTLIKSNNGNIVLLEVLSGSVTLTLAGNYKKNFTLSITPRTIAVHSCDFTNNSRIGENNSYTKNKIPFIILKEILDITDNALLDNDEIKKPLFNFFSSQFSR